MSLTEAVRFNYLLNQLSQTETQTFIVQLLNKPNNQTNDNYLNIEQFSNNNNSLKVDINLYNLFLFIFLGIVIILLIDQITKLVSLHKI